MTQPPPNHTHPQPAWRQFIGRRLHFMAAASLVALFVSQTVPHWFAGLFSHFIPHYAAVMLLAALFSFGRRRWFWLIGSGILAAWTTLPWFNTTEKHSNNTAATQKLLWYNVNLDNRDAAAESRRLIAANADILALAEIDARDAGWRSLREHYPHGCIHEDDSPFALAVWSKTPLQSCEIRFAGLDETGGFPYIRAVANSKTVYALHPPPPVNAAMAAAQEHYLFQAAGELAAESGTVLVAGDLNATPYSPLFRRFTAAAQIQPQTPYLLPTWLPFGLNIDHILTRGTTAQVQALQFAASDHRPLLAEFR